MLSCLPGTTAYSTTKNWSPRYSWNIAESGVKHQKSKSINQHLLVCLLQSFTNIMTRTNDMMTMSGLNLTIRLSWILVASSPIQQTNKQTYRSALTHRWCLLSGEKANTNSIVFGLTWLGLELNTIYHTRVEARWILHHRCGFDFIQPEM